jgi:hypothetical protein
MKGDAERPPVMGCTVSLANKILARFKMQWLFEGLGTLLVGIVLGVAGDRAWISVGMRRSTKQRQKARDHATQTQVAGDMSASPPGRTGQQNPPDG